MNRTDKELMAEVAARVALEDPENEDKATTAIYIEKAAQGRPTLTGVKLNQLVKVLLSNDQKTFVASQPEGESAYVRKLIEEARKKN